MEKIKRYLHSGVGLLLTAAAILVLIGVINLIVGGLPNGMVNEPMAQQGQTEDTPEIYPPPPTDLPPEPFPTETAVPEPSLTPEIGSPEIPPAGAGKAAILFNGDIWLVEAGVEPQTLTNFGDVSSIFGWNNDGTRLLFGRGRVKHAEFISDTTELWFLDLTNNQCNQLTSENPVSSAAWSPQGDKIAYSKDGNLLIIMDLKGIILYQQDHVLLGFSWSPDGLSLAIRYYTPEMDHGDLVFVGLTIWQYTEGILQPVDDELEVIDEKPVWSIDGHLILFERLYYGQDSEAPRGLVVYNLMDKSIKSLGFDTDYITYLIRSPRMDLVSFQLHNDIYIIDFNGNYIEIGKGEKPAWGADGTSLIYHNIDGSQKSINMEDEGIIKPISGGSNYAVDLYIPSIFYFISGG